MASVPFSWMWGDPAGCVDQLRSMKDRMAKAEKTARERELRNKKRRIRKLVKEAMNRQLKGQK